ncbi:hypothetical protein C8F04DRAFT_1273085 [Mycena alexandri]|uniref:3-carboxymuconate cyclase n=1 Tax=Mycena alexandri TaxID=1745969 RepID=A0AAD6S850_9AGAR|nr:hypothetical protein C8F04DRAFT_1273085 [Mycena alexandri]
MKSSALFILASAVSAAVATCNDTTPVARIPLAKKGISTKGNVGAAYFMSNEPTGNYLISSLVGPDGKLTLYEGLYTGGNGMKGVPGPPVNVLDALFTQDSIGVSRPGKFLANVNAGSNSVTIYSINEQNPAELTIVGKPVWSGGEFPTALTINKAGTRLCVVNGGAISGVSCYTVDTRKGLTPIPNGKRDLGLNQTTPATGPGNTPGDIIFSPDEKQLIVSIKTGTGYLAIWNVNHDGSLSSNFTKVSGGELPFSLTPITGVDGAFFASDPGMTAGYTIYDLRPTAKTTALTTKIAGQGAICWSVYSPKSGNYYLMDIITSNITEVHIEKSLKSNVQYHMDIDGPMDSSLVTIGKHDFMYTLAANRTGITVMNVAGPGNLQVIQRLDVADPAAAAKITLNRLDVQGMAVFLR